MEDMEHADQCPAENEHGERVLACIAEIIADRATDPGKQIRHDRLCRLLVIVGRRATDEQDD